MVYQYKPKGICPSLIEFDIKNDVIEDVQFIGGCDGNLKGLSRLIKGMNVSEAATRLAGISCGRKRTSCPDQLSIALLNSVSAK